MFATLLWSLGGLGTAAGGLWIAALFVPTIAALLKSTLDFLRSPLGTILGVGALGLFLFSSGWIGGDIHGTSETRVEWKADIAARAKAAAQREIAVRVEMKKTADAASASDETFSNSIDEKVNANVAKNPARPECLATGDDIRRLLSIR